MILILLAAAAVSGVLAFVENDSFADVIIILAVVIINAILGVYQESKAEKAIEALQEMSAATSRVLRGGQIQTIPSEDLVKGDIILLEAGDAVPADARILESASLKVEEAALTGESVPVTKFIDMLKLSDGQKDIRLATGKTWSTWAAPWYTAADAPSSPPPACRRKWVKSPTRWSRPRRARRPYRESSASFPAS